jgi:hypothetical protein
MYAEHLQSMVYSKTLDASAVPELIKFIDEAFTNWEKSLVDELGQKARSFLTQLSPKSFDITHANLVSNASHFHYRFAKRSKTHEQSNARILCT